MKTRTATRIAAAAAAAVALGLAAAGCGSDDSAASVEVADPWARTSAMSQTMGAAYMEITGGSEDDALVGASVPSDIAAEAQIHETVAASSAGGSEDEMDGMDGMETTGSGGGETSGSMDDMGEMTMREVDSIEIPAGETVALEPGGYHVMLMDLAGPLEAGTTFELTLEFEQAGEQTVEVTVRDA